MLTYTWPTVNNAYNGGTPEPRAYGDNISFHCLRHSKARASLLLEHSWRGELDQAIYNQVKEQQEVYI